MRGHPSEVPISSQTVHRFFVLNLTDLKKNAVELIPADFSVVTSQKRRFFRENSLANIGRQKGRVRLRGGDPDAVQGRRRTAIEKRQKHRQV